MPPTRKNTQANSPLFLITSLVSLLLILAACQKAVYTARPPQNPSPGSSQTPPSTQTQAAAPATRTPGRPTLTPTAEVDQTRVFQTSAANEATQSVEIELTHTGIVSDIRATVTPQTIQSFPSPDGKWTAQVMRYDCTQVVPEHETTHAYEILSIAQWTVETQLQYCHGVGAVGLGGLFWSANSQFFYFTTAREGGPDGGGPWVRPISRFDVTTGKRETLAMAAQSPDQKQIAGGQGADLVIWEMNDDAVSRFPGPGQDLAWMGWIAWSPDGGSLAYLTHIVCDGPYPCPSTLTRVDINKQTTTPLLGKSDPVMIKAEWTQPNLLKLYGADYQTIYTYDLVNGKLLSLPTATP